MHLALGFCHAAKHRNGLLFHPIRQAAPRNELADGGEIASMTVFGPRLIAVSMVMPVSVLVMMVVFDEPGLVLFGAPAALEPEHSRKLMRFGEFFDGLKIIAVKREYEDLSHFVRANRLECDGVGRRRRHGLSLGIMKIQAEPRRHIRLEDAEFHAALVGPDQHPPMRSVILVVHFVFVSGVMLVIVTAVAMRMRVSRAVGMRVFMRVFVREVDIKFRPRDAHFLSA